MEEEDPNLPTFKLRQTGPPRAKVLARAARELYVPADVDDTHPIFDLADNSEAGDVGDTSEIDGPAEAHSQEKQPYPLLLRFALMAGFIALGCANAVLRQILAVSLWRFSYMLSLVTSLACAPAYLWFLFCLVKMKIVPMKQLSWAWEANAGLKSWSRAPPVLWYIFSGLGAALGDTFGYICTPYVAGPIQQLLVQSIVVFTALLSYCILRSRYSAYQCLGLLGLEIAVVAGVVPSLGQGSSSTDGFFAILLGGSCFFNSLAFVLREFCFRSFKAGRGKDRTLNIFVANVHESLSQLPFTLLLVILAQATGQADGQDVLTYLRQGTGCLDGIGPLHYNCTFAKRWTGLYIVLHILWNLLYLMNLKVNGALATFVGLKVTSPISAMLFAYVDWPVISTTPVLAMTWCALLLVLVCTTYFMWESMRQSERAMEEPSQATCCWPFGESRYLGIDGEGNLGDVDEGDLDGPPE